MTWGTIPDWLIAGAAVVYTVGTILLWRVTVRALEATRDAFKLNFLIALHSIEKETSGGARDRRDFLSQMNQQWLRKRFTDLLQKTFPYDFQSIIGPGDEAETQSPAGPSGT